jgi:hypothetical protein
MGTPSWVEGSSPSRSCSARPERSPLAQTGRKKKTTLTDRRHAEPELDKTSSSDVSKRSKRMRISQENLHISAFAIVGDGRGSILLIKAGGAHPLSFRRGRLLLPASMLQFGERPLTAAKRALTVELDGADALEPQFREIQSYMGSHWDLCFIYDADGRKAPKLSAKAPYTDASYYRLDALPRDAIAEDHLEVIDGQTDLKER